MGSCEAPAGKDWLARPTELEATEELQLSELCIKERPVRTLPLDSASLFR